MPTKPICLIQWLKANEYAMADQIQIMGKKAKRGDRMTNGKGWRLAVLKGDKRIFVGTLLQTIDFSDKRIAIFSVPK